MRARQPWSTWSAAAYLAAAVACVLLGGDVARYVVAIALGTLALGTALMHGTQNYGWPETLDHAGMAAVMGGIAVHAWPIHAAWAVVAIVAAPLVQEVWRDAKIEYAMSVYVVFATAGLAVSGAWVGLVVGTVLMGLGLGFWLIERFRAGPHEDILRDRLHMAWHVLTAGGLAVLWLAGG